MFGLFRKKNSFVSSGLLNNSVDAHCHLLPGVDDGIKTMEDALAVLAQMEKNGIRRVWCTPHIMEDVPNATVALRERFEELKAAYKGPIRLELASENMMDELFNERLEAGDILFHSGKRILVETSTWNCPRDFWGVLERIKAAGYTPVLAHPERYRYLGKSDYQRLVKMGVILQMNYASLVGFYGPTEKKNAEYILSNGWYSMTGSDCHRLRVWQSQIEEAALSDDVIEQITGIMHPFGV